MMAQNAANESLLRWRVDTLDRVGMVRDVATVIAQFEGNLEAMEVVTGAVYLRFRVPYAVATALRDSVAAITGVENISSVDKLPFEADEQQLIRRIMQQEEVQTALTFSSLVVASPAMGRVIRMANTVAAADVPILISGESGTGKELLARAIHNASPRHVRRFVPINCAALPASLLESELFGYADGSFTGAKRGGRAGLFEVADGGTLFLDEIGEMEIALQAKLLRVLADGELRRVGSTSSRLVNVRIIAATNRDLSKMLKNGQFREDLFYRLNVIPLHIPPLRERRADILPLVERSLERMVRKLERSIQLTDGARQALLGYDYPGNVRELQNMMERACYLASAGEIEAHHLMLSQIRSLEAVQNELDGGHSSQLSLRKLVRDFEQQIIRDMVVQTGSLRLAAKQLGVTHSTLSNKLREGP